MIRFTVTRLLAAANLAAIAVPAAAQDFSQPPTFGSAALKSGFAPDPQAVSMVPGGSTDAARTLGGACVGGIAEAPDYRIDFAAGQYVLQFYVRSNEDTTLVINAPDGSWYCNDDTDGFDPAVFFQSPMSGQYDIWIGTFSGGIGTQATLYITEQSTRY